MYSCTQKYLALAWHKTFGCICVATYSYLTAAVSDWFHTFLHLNCFLAYHTNFQKRNWEEGIGDYLNFISVNEQNYKDGAS